MLTQPSVGCSWSGGKDSCFALMQAIRQGAVPKVLLNVMNEQGKLSRSHGLPAYLLAQQADAMQIPLFTIASSWKDYERLFTAELNRMKEVHHIQAMVFGDIDLDEHREWEEKVCAAAGLLALLPLWKKPRKELLLDMLDHGIRSMIVSCNSIMGEAFLGRMLDCHLIPELEARNIDVCGEAGEFHTVVLNCPLFRREIKLPGFIKVQHEDYHFLQFL